MPYAAVIHQGARQRMCEHLHDSIADAWQCAKQKEREWGLRGAALVGAEMQQDGVPHYRNLTEAEMTELEALQAD